MTWNFPSAEAAKITVSLRVLGSGVRISLCDHWYNACDETVGGEAPFVIDVTDTPTDVWTDITFDYDTMKGLCTVSGLGDTPITISMRGDAPCGLSYLHVQTLAEAADFDGTLVRSLHMQKTV